VLPGVEHVAGALAFNTVGDFYWQAVYSGDANNDPATSVCTSEHLIVIKKSPTIATRLSDTARPHLPAPPGRTATNPPVDPPAGPAPGPREHHLGIPKNPRRAARAGCEGRRLHRLGDLGAT
jgi:hypothetical protein